MMAMSQLSLSLADKWLENTRQGASIANKFNWLCVCIGFFVTPGMSGNHLVPGSLIGSAGEVKR
jgi:hypothetical protein